MDAAEEIILAACRAGRRGFKTPGTWGMREDCLLGGYGTTARTPCVVMDLERTKPHPTRFGFYVPIVIASGDTWEAVLNTLRANGELQEAK
jgi:hypothetical protein